MYTVPTSTFTRCCGIPTCKEADAREPGSRFTPACPRIFPKLWQKSWWWRLWSRQASKRALVASQRDARSKDAPGLGNTNGKNCRERQKYRRKRSSGWKPPRRKSLSFGKKGLQPESLSKEPFWTTDTKKRRTGWEVSPRPGVPGYANRPEKSCCWRTKEDQTVCVWEKSGLKRILDSQA